MFTDPHSAAKMPAPDAPVRKFLFDQSFDAGVAPKAQERKPVLMKPEQLDQMKEEAFRAGVEAGRKQAAEEQDRMMELLIQQLDARIAEAASKTEPLLQQMEMQARQMVLTIAGRILPEYTARYGLGEIEALLTSAIGEMVHEPRLVVRIHEALFDQVNTKIHEITVQKAYAGKVVVLADPEVAAGDCRVEWADGGIERRTEATWSDIRHIMTPDTQ